MDGNLRGTSTLGQGGPESNGNEKVFHPLQSNKTDHDHQMQLSIMGHSIFFFWWVGGFDTTTLDTIGVFVAPNVRVYISNTMWLGINTDYTHTNKLE